MNLKLLPRKLHKWLALLVGAQLLLWSLSGFYMVAVDIDIIHGDMLVQNERHGLSDSVLNTLPITTIIAQYPLATAISLQYLGDAPVYVLQTDESRRLLDARSGELLSPLASEAAAEIARYHYAGSGSVTAVELITANPPTEIQFMPLPVWRVDFDDAWGSSFYIDPQSGHFMTRRHTLWRVFDFLWMLHIMDYAERDNVDNGVLRVAAPLALLFAFSGIWLLYTRLKRRKVPA